MRAKIKTFVVAVVVLSALRVAAADEVPRIPDFYFYSCDSRFAEATAYFNEALDIKILLPDGFVDKNKRGVYIPNPKRSGGPGLVFNAIAESAGGDCLLLVHDEGSPVENFVRMSHESDGESVMADGYWNVDAIVESYCKDSNLSQADVKKCVKHVDASQLNADRACMVNLPVNGDTLDGKRYVGKTMLLFDKAGRVPMDVTLLFTTEGLKKRQKYEAALLESVGYGNRKDWKYDKKLNRILEIKHFAPYIELTERQHSKYDLELMKKLSAMKK